MKFELRIACSYLMPTRRNWSRSLLSLLSIFVVSSVVWLAMVFLSVSSGLQNLWIKKLIAIDAPIRIRPTDHYFRSYFHNIDSLSLKSNFKSKSLWEKAESKIDPHNFEIDGPLPNDLPPPQLDTLGQLQNPVKALFESLEQLPNLRVADGTTAYSNCIIDVEKANDEIEQKRSYHQMSLISPLIWRRELIDQLKHPLGADWPLFFDRWFDAIGMGGKGDLLWRHLKIASVVTRPEGITISVTSHPQKGTFDAIAVDRSLHLCATKGELKALRARYGADARAVKGRFCGSSIVVDNDSLTHWSLIYHGALTALHPLSPSGQELNWRQISCPLTTQIQGMSIALSSPLGQLMMQSVEAIGDECVQSAIAAALREYSSSKFVDAAGDQRELYGALLPIHYRRNGARMGDLGVLQRSIFTPGGVDVESLPVMVCGFFDAAMMPLGTKVILTEPKWCALLHEAMPENEQRRHTGISIFCPLKSAHLVSRQIQELLLKRGVEKYWSVHSYEDFEHIRDLLGQLKSDQLLLGVLAVIIIAVACSNIISMLLLLVVEKKREIAIFRALGASSGAIARIFGLCGFLTGSISGLLGAFLAQLTLFHIDTLTHFLSSLWGRELFHPAYYGESLPNQMTPSAISFTLITTAGFSALAALLPARSAARLNPSKLLRDS